MNPQQQAARGCSIISRLRRKVVVFSLELLSTYMYRKHLPLIITTNAKYLLIPLLGTGLKSVQSKAPQS